MTIKIEFECFEAPAVKAGDTITEYAVDGSVKVYTVTQAACEFWTSVDAQRFNNADDYATQTKLYLVPDATYEMTA